MVGGTGCGPAADSCTPVRGENQNIQGCCRSLALAVPPAMSTGVGSSILAAYRTTGLHCASFSGLPVKHSLRSRNTSQQECAGQTALHTSSWLMATPIPSPTKRRAGGAGTRVVRISAATLPTATVGDTDGSIAAWSRKTETVEQRTRDARTKIVVCCAPQRLCRTR